MSWFCKDWPFHVWGDWIDYEVGQIVIKDPVTSDLKAKGSYVLQVRTCTVCKEKQLHSIKEHLV